MLDCVAIRTGVDDDVRSSQIGRDRIAHAAEVDGAHRTDEAIESAMRVPAQHEVGVAAFEQLRKFVVARAKPEPEAVVGAR